MSYGLLSEVSPYVFLVGRERLGLSGLAAYAPASTGLIGHQLDEGPVTPTSRITSDIPFLLGEGSAPLVGWAKAQALLEESSKALLLSEASLSSGVSFLPTHRKND